MTGVSGKDGEDVSREVGASPADAGRSGALRAEPAPQSQAKPPVADAGFWPFRITSYAPSHRQFGLDENLTPEQITAAVGFEPKERDAKLGDGKVTLQWAFYAELTYPLPEGGFGSTSTCCKIWDYKGSRWSAYGWPEVFEQIGLKPVLHTDYGTWQHDEDDNPTLAYLAAGLLAKARGDRS